MSGARAELIADRGAAAESEEFFRSRPFLDAEGVTHSLRIEADGPEGRLELVAPLVVRDIDAAAPAAAGGDRAAAPLRDATSPYGYPGLTRSGTGERGLDPAEVDWSATGLVSVFLRHTLAAPPLAGSSERNVVQIADPALPPKSRPSDRRQVRRNLEAGYALELVPGPEASAAQRAAFLAAYEETMRRTRAAQHYFFGAVYFDRVLAAERTWLVLARDPDGEVAAASLAAVSDGYLHYYLSGSRDTHLGDSPMKNVVARLVEHAGELQLPLNLGGGMRPGDALEEFKRGFANRSLAWHTSELVCDPARYRELSGGREAGGYFPAYRA